MLTIDTMLNNVRDDLLEEYDVAGDGDGQLDVGGNADEEVNAKTIADTVILYLEENATDLGEIVEEEALHTAISDAFAGGAADEDGDGLVSEAEIKKALRPILTVDVFQNGGENKPFILEEDNLGDVQSSTLDALFEGKEEDETIWVEVGGTKYEIYNQDTNYAFFEGTDDNTVAHVIQSVDTQDLPDLNGPNPARLGEIFNSNDGERVYVGFDGNIYGLTDNGNGYAVGGELIISDNGTIEGRRLEVNSDLFDNSPTEELSSEDIPDNTTLEATDGMYNSNRLSEIVHELDEVDSEDDTVTEDTFLNELTSEEKIQLATNLKAIMLGDEGSQPIEDADIIAYVNKITSETPNKTVEDWFNSINLEEGVQETALEAREIAYAIYGEASIDFSDRDAPSHVLQGDLDNDNVTINWAKEKPHMKEGTIQIGDELYMLRYRNGEYSYFNKVIREYVPFPDEPLE